MQFTIQEVAEMRKHTHTLSRRKRRFPDMGREHPASRAFAVQPRRERRTVASSTTERRPS